MEFAFFLKEHTEKTNKKIGVDFFQKNRFFSTLSIFQSFFVFFL